MEQSNSNGFDTIRDLLNPNVCLYTHMSIQTWKGGQIYTMAEWQVPDIWLYHWGQQCNYFVAYYCHLLKISFNELKQGKVQGSSKMVWKNYIMKSTFLVFHYRFFKTLNLENSILTQPLLCLTAAALLQIKLLFFPVHSMCLQPHS